ncbi:MAG TPA: DUF4214 domain-containing protein, partial [Pyrinomonadaceae bacterium]|nr:DUF4214 domain-containing protein [Pyrinomonadaceae bacterium]
PQESEAAKQLYVPEFMARPEFTALYGGLTTPEQAAAFVAKLEQTAGVTLANRQTLITRLQNGQATAAETLRAFVESPEVLKKFWREGLIELMYFGFLRRNSDAVGFANYMSKLGAGAEARAVVFDFLYSHEYRKRFGQP